MYCRSISNKSWRRKIIFFRGDTYHKSTQGKKTSQTKKSIGRCSHSSLKIGSGSSNISNSDSCGVFQDVTNMEALQCSTPMTQPEFYSNNTRTGRLGCKQNIFILFSNYLS